MFRPSALQLNNKKLLNMIQEVQLEKQINAFDVAMLEAYNNR